LGKVSDLLRVKVEIPDLQELIKERGSLVIKEITFRTYDEFIDRMRQKKTGKLYPRGKVFHQASAPGEAPAVDSSNLINSIIPDYKDLRGEIVMNDYGFILDQYKDRDFIIPSLDAVMKRFESNKN
jgi:hypothetical protein